MRPNPLRTAERTRDFEQQQHELATPRPRPHCFVDLVLDVVDGIDDNDPGDDGNAPGFASLEG